MQSSNSLASSAGKLVAILGATVRDELQRHAMWVEHPLHEQLDDRLSIRIVMTRFKVHHLCQPINHNPDRSMSRLRLRQVGDATTSQAPSGKGKGTSFPAGCLCEPLFL